MKCSYCSTDLNLQKNWYFPNAQGQKKIEDMVQVLKHEGQGKKYDCLMGISGGLDSSYLAYLGTQKWGLRVAAVHIDDGYDTEVSKKNIQNFCENAKI